MTREAVPSFDLYEELQVARHASAEVIEAAFRYLVKQHRPDTGRPTDDDRLRRLALAHEWLIDPARRERYDAATAGSEWSKAASTAASTTASTTAGGGSDTSVRGGDAAHRRTADAAAERPSFGPNAGEVRQLLATLRALDWDRAIEIWEARSEADAAGHAAARRRAEQAASGWRHQGWLLAREAAVVITRGKLGASSVTAQLCELVADAAGAVALRDLLSAADYDLLAGPWTGRDAAGTGQTATRPVAAAAAAKPAAEAGAAGVRLAGMRAAATRRAAAASTIAADSVRAWTAAVRARPGWAKPMGGGVGSSVALPAASIVVALAALAIGIGVMSRPVIAPDDPSASARSSPGVVAAVATSSLAPPGPLEPPSPSLETPAAPGVTPDPGPGTTNAVAADTVVPGLVTPRITLPPQPGATPTPVIGPTRSPSPMPTGTEVPTSPPTPSPTPAPTPSPTPAPTPTPAPMCDVPQLVGLLTNHAATAWANRGFSGTVSFDPVVPPHYTIGWQSLAADSSAPCTSGITVRKQAP